MAKIQSAKKAHRASLRKRVFNTRRKRAMKDSVKEINKLIVAKKASEAVALLPKVQQDIDKATKRGVIKPNAAARTKSRIVARLKAIA